MHVNGPYYNSRHERYTVTIIHDNGKQSGMFYSRWLMQEHLGRKLERHEEVHHKDGNKLNDSLDNLEVVSRTKHSKLHTNEAVKFTCQYCLGLCEMPLGEYNNWKKKSKNGPFCSKTCAAYYNWEERKDVRSK